MGGAGPYVEFNPSYQSTPWADRTGLSNLSREELEEAYTRCGGFLREKERELVDEYGWSSAQDVRSDSLFRLTGTVTAYNRSHDVQLHLPLTFSSFLDDNNKETWGRMFGNHCLFDPRRQNRSNASLFIDSPTPMSDIFYLLQTLTPGMLLIAREDDIDEVGELLTTRALPSVGWVKDHQVMLEIVFGSEERYQKLLAAVTGPGLSPKSFHEEWVTRYDYDDDSAYYTNIWGQREVLDYTACDQECGNCGRCDY